MATISVLSFPKDLVRFFVLFYTPLAQNIIIYEKRGRKISHIVVFFFFILSILHWSISFCYQTVASGVVQQAVTFHFNF